MTTIVSIEGVFINGGSGIKDVVIIKGGLVIERNFKNDGRTEKSTEHGTLKLPQFIIPEIIKGDTVKHTGHIFKNTIQKYIYTISMGLILKETIAHITKPISNQQTMLKGITNEVIVLGHTDPV